MLLLSPAKAGLQTGPHWLRSMVNKGTITSQAHVSISVDGTVLPDQIRNVLGADIDQAIAAGVLAYRGDEQIAD